MNTEKICDALPSREIKTEGIWKKKLVILKNKRYYYVILDKDGIFVDFWFKSKKDMDCFCMVFSEMFPYHLWYMLQKKLPKYRFENVINEVTIYHDLHK